MNEVDIIVVGYGFAGAVAAIAAHDAGATVMLLEKQPEPGGISVCSAGGIRVSDNADSAFAYLKATNAGTTPEPVLQRLAKGMTEISGYVAELGKAVGIETSNRGSPGNYPLPGFESFGFVYVEEIPGFDPAATFPNVRGSAAGARLFKLVMDNVARRSSITVRLGIGVERLLIEGGKVCGVVTPKETLRARRGVILACGGFEGDEEAKRQFWPLKPVMPAAVRTNTGDGMKMAQAVGANLWHLWHYHGSYGFRHPDPAYPFGIRLKRLPDWVPGIGLRGDVRMSWILVDRNGRRFGNEYEPYMQDTGHRSMEFFDPASQSFPRVPAYLVIDSAGRDLYPLSAPTWHDSEVAAKFSQATPRSLDEEILVKADTLEELARNLGIPAENFTQTVAEWNEMCAKSEDSAFARPASSMMKLSSPPYYGAPIWPIVSNTQGGPAHDEHQRILDVFGEPIPGLYEAGEIGSIFGHLYMSGGNIAECFIGGRIAGETAARSNPDPHVERAPA